MNKTRKGSTRVFSLLLSLLMLLSLVPFTALADGNTVDTDKDTYEVGDAVMVTASTDVDGAWVSIIKEGDDDNATSYYWYYVNGSEGGKTWKNGETYNIFDGVCSEREGYTREWRLEPGSYRIVMLHGNYEKITEKKITLTASTATTTSIRAEKDVFTEGDPIRLQVDGTGDHVWVAVYAGKHEASESFSGNYMYWYYAANHNGAMLDVLSAADTGGSGGAFTPGDYTAVLFADGGYTVDKVAQFSVKEAETPIVPLATDKEVYEWGEPIMVTTNYSAANAWVGLYKRGEPNDGSVVSLFWYYVSGTDPVDITQNNPQRPDDFTPGDYTVVLYADGGYTVYATVDITINAEAVPPQVKLLSWREEDALYVDLVAGSDFEFAGIAGVLAFDQEAFAFVKGNSAIAGLPYEDDLKDSGLGFSAETAENVSVKENDIILSWEFSFADGYVKGEEYDFSVEFDDFYDDELEDIEINSPVELTYKEAADGAPATVSLKAEKNGENVVVSLVADSDFYLCGYQGTLSFDAEAFAFVDGAAGSTEFEYMGAAGDSAVTFILEAANVSNVSVGTGDTLAVWTFSLADGYVKGTEYEFEADQKDFYDAELNDIPVNMPVSAVFQEVVLLSTDKEEYKCNEPIMVTTNFEGNKAWVGLYKKDETYDPNAGGAYSIFWYYLDGNPNPMNILDAGDLNGRAEEYGPGEYKVVLFNNDGYVPEETVYITVLDHDWGEWTVTTEPTCTEKGEETRTCKLCGKTETREIEALGHDWGEWTVTKAATCTEKGEETRTCSRCGEKETRETEALGHDLVKTEAKAATCTEAGNSEYYTCRRCGKYFSDAEGKNEIKEGSWVIAALGHDWGEWTVTKAATCEEKGEETRTCARCGETETREIAATGHKWGTPTYVWADDNSSVTATVVCENDDAHKQTETVATTSEVTKEATETETGLRVYTAVFTNPLFTKQTKEEEIPCLPAPEIPERLFGRTRTETAVAISEATFPNGSENVILASGDNYPDALAGGPLAYALDAPILLVCQSKPDEATLAEIDRLKAKNVYILGGTGVISDSVKTLLEGKGLNVERLAGKDRFGTAVAIAEKLQELKGTPSEVFFVFYNNYPDALAVSNIAALKGSPILYIQGNGVLESATAKHMDGIKDSVQSVWILAGPAIISSNAETNLGKYGTVTRIYGSDRYATCILVNEKFADVLTGDSMCLACGTNYPDALAGSVLAAKLRSPLMLVGKTLTDDQRTYVKSRHPAHVYAFGGTFVLSDEVFDEVKQAAK